MIDVLPWQAICAICCPLAGQSSLRRKPSRNSALGTVHSWMPRNDCNAARHCGTRGRASMSWFHRNMRLGGTATKPVHRCTHAARRSSLLRRAAEGRRTARCDASGRRGDSGCLNEAPSEHSRRSQPDCFLLPQEQSSCHGRNRGSENRHGHNEDFGGCANDPRPASLSAFVGWNRQCRHHSFGPRPNDRSRATLLPFGVHGATGSAASRTTSRTFRP